MGHFASQCVQLPDQVAFSCASDGGVAGHVAYGVQVDGKTDGFLPQPRRGQGGLDAGVACADDGDIVFSGGKFLHWDFFLRRLRRRGGVFSSIGPWAVRPRTPDLLLVRAKSRQKRARTIWFWTPLITGVFCFAPEAQSVWSKLTAVRSAGLLRLFQRGCRWPLPF